MFNDAPAWKVEYDDPLLTASFRNLVLIERADCLWTTAVHTFSIAGNSDGKQWIDEIYKLLKDKRDDDFAFTIKDLPENKVIPTHTHFITSFYEAVALDRDEISQYVVITHEKKAKLHVDGRFKVRKGELSEMVSSIIGEAGLRIGEIEQTKSPEEFKTLHQPGWTGYEFITNHLVRRATNSNGEGGYQLYTNRGDRICFTTVGYRAKTLTIDKDQLRKVYDHFNSWQAACDWGNKIALVGFDPEKLEIIVGGGAVNQSVQIDSTRFSNHRAQTKQTIKSFAVNYPDRQGKHHKYFGAVIRGDEKSGGIDFPFKVDLTDTKWKEDDAASGLCVVRTHQISEGTYNLTLLCVQG